MWERIKKNSRIILLLIWVNIIIRICLIILCIYYIYKGWIEVERIARFIIILSIIWGYIIIWKYVERRVLDYTSSVRKKYSKRYEERQANEEYKKEIKRIKRVIKILTKIYVAINPVLLLVQKVSYKMIYFIRWMNLKLINYLEFSRILILGFMYLIMRPTLVGYWLYYKTLVRWKKIGVVNILLKRVEGLIISVLIMTDIYKYIYDKIGYIGIIIIIYIILVMISYYYKEINKFYGEKRIIINMNNLNNIRNNNTILGTFIHNLIQLMRDLFEGIEVHNYFHLYIGTVNNKEGRLIQFESTVGALDDIWRWEIKNKVSVYMYLVLIKIVDLGYDSTLRNWYLRVIQYKKKEENKRIVEEMYKSQIKKIKEALFFFYGN